jgi:uncharacterized protein YukE
MTMAAEKTFRVDLEALARSVSQVSEQGEDLAGAHLSSDNRIAVAQSGWVGASAAALQDRTAIWLEQAKSSDRGVDIFGVHVLVLSLAFKP